MFTYVKAKNFKSLKNIEFNLNKTKTSTNKFAAIYGENGSGKTNIVEIFKFLEKSLLARGADESAKKLPKEFWDYAEKFKENSLKDFSDIWKVYLQLEDYRMINEEETTELEYGFKRNNKNGTYSIKFKDEVLEEKLYYFCGKQSGTLFEIKKKEKGIDIYLNKNIFLNEKYREELTEIIEKYWGKYTFLSLFLFDMSQKNREYIDKRISRNFLNAVEKLLITTVHVNDVSTKAVLRNLGKNRVNIQYGIIKKEKLKEIEEYEKVLNIFFTQAYADIKEVKYDINNINEAKVKYELYFKKQIGGELKSIPSRLESAGTQRILRVFALLMDAMLGETVIIDEIDNGIHDMLMRNIITSIKDEITGQLIITTHNTLLLETLPKENIYVLSVDYNGNKSINSLKEYSNIQRNNNARALYLKGAFGGIPFSDYIDFEEIKYTLEEFEKQKGNTNE